MANTSLLLANPDFNSIEGSLKSFMKVQDRFKDYNFEGSNLATLINLLAYNTYQSDFIANMVASEMFMDTASQRPSIISHAKELGYTPRSARAASATINIKIEPDQSTGVIIVPRGTLFNSQVGSRSYTFSTDRSYTMYPVNNVYEILNVPIYEGFNVVEQFQVQPFEDTRTRQRFILSNPMIDTRSLTIHVDGVEHKLATTILDLTSSSQVFFLEMNNDGRYEVVFGSDLIGRQPIASQIVTANYNVTVGEDANGANVFRASSAIGGQVNITVTTTSPAAGGAAPESDESIRRYAPLMYQTRGRAVTRDDYKVLLKQEFPEIQAINVYGGELMDPPQYGRVFISVDTMGALGASNGSKNAYLRFIKEKSPVTVTPVFIDPTFMSLSVTSTLYFDYVNHNTSIEEVNASALLAVNKFNETELADFDKTFLYSKFVQALDNCHPAVFSNDTTVHMVLSLDSDKLQKESQILNYHNPVAQWSVRSSQFQFANKTCTIEDNGEGVLNVVTPSSNQSVVLREVGTIDYQTGVITVKPIEAEKVFGYAVRIFAQPVSKNISAVQNVLLNVDVREIKLNSVPSKK